jgi:hypothetical protein
MAVSFGVFILATVIVRRPAELGKPRMTPWVGVQMMCVLMTVFSFTDLVSLMTGTPVVGRQGY